MPMPRQWQGRPRLTMDAERSTPEPEPDDDVDHAHGLPDEVLPGWVNVGTGECVDGDGRVFAHGTLPGSRRAELLPLDPRLPIYAVS